MRTRLSNHIRGVLKTFGLLPGGMRGLPFDRKVEALLAGRSDVALIVRPMLVAWRQLREQITTFDKAIRLLVKSNSACRLLMSVPGIGVLSALAYVSTVEMRTLRPVTIGRRAFRADAPAISIRRGRSQWQDIAARRQPRSHLIVRSCRLSRLKRVGGRDRQALGRRQSAGGARQKAFCYSPWLCRHKAWKSAMLSRGHRPARCGGLRSGTPGIRQAA